MFDPPPIYPAPLHNLPIKRKLLSVTQKQEQEFWIINKTALRNLYTVENNNSEFRTEILAGMKVTKNVLCKGCFEMTQNEVLYLST